MEYKEAKTPNQNSKQKNKSKKSEDNVRSLCHSFKHTNIRITGVWEGEERESKNLKTYLKIMTENFPNLVKE